MTKRYAKASRKSALDMGAVMLTGGNTPVACSTASSAVVTAKIVTSPAKTAPMRRHTRRGEVDVVRFVAGWRASAVVVMGSSSVRFGAPSIGALHPRVGAAPAFSTSAGKSLNPDLFNRFGQPRRMRQQVVPLRGAGRAIRRPAVERNGRCAIARPLQQVGADR